MAAVMSHVKSPAMSRTRLSRAVTRDLCWNAALLLKTFSVSDLAEKAELSDHQAYYFIQIWIKEGLILREVAGLIELQRFRVLAVEGARPQIDSVETPPGNMWTAMRGLRSFSPRDIAAHATSELTVVTLEMAQSYCQMLVRASYLRVMDKAIPGRRDAVYRLIRNTGPRPPVERRVRVVIDENQQKIVHIAGYAG